MFVGEEGYLLADEKQDPLITSLMALAVSAAPLIKRARESGMFKAETASAAPQDTPAAASETVDYAGQKSALQDIIVSQAIKIAALETEVVRLTALKSRHSK